MKRREFLRTSTLLITSPTAAINVAHTKTTNKANCAHELAPVMGKIIISRSGLPAQFWTANEDIFKAISNVLPDEGSEGDLTEGRARPLRTLAIDVPPHHLDDEALSIVATAADINFQESIRKQNYEAAFRIMESRRTTNGFRTNRLRKSIETVIQKNRLELHSVLTVDHDDFTMEEIFARLSTEINGTVTLDDLTAISEFFSANLSEPAREAIVALSVAAIFVTAAAYVVVVVAVGAWVWVSGPSEIEPAGNAKPGISRFDPVLVSDYDRTLKLCALTGDRELARQAQLRLLRAESEAVVGALRSCGYLNGPAEQDDNLINAATHYAARVAGIEA